MYGLREWGAGGTAGQDAASGSAPGGLGAPGALQAASQHQPAHCEGSAARPELPAAAEGPAVHVEEAPTAEGAAADPEPGTWLGAVYHALCLDIQPGHWMTGDELARCAASRGSLHSG